MKLTTTPTPKTMMVHIKPHNSSLLRQRLELKRMLCPLHVPDVAIRRLEIEAVRLVQELCFQLHPCRPVVVVVDVCGELDPARLGPVPALLGELVLEVEISDRGAVFPEFLG